MKNSPLKGKRILLTRPNNEPLASQLKKAGASVMDLPLIDIALKADKEISDDVLGNIASYQWLIFSSINGVRGFFEEFFKKYLDIRCIGPCRIAAVGTASVEELKKFFIQTDVMPLISTGEEMAKAVVKFETLENLMILNVSGNLQDKNIVKILQDEGRAIVDTFPVYETKLITISADNAALKDFTSKGADAVFFASPSAVQSFVKNAKSLSLKTGATHPKAFSIGPKTSEEMKKHGLSIAAEASSPDKIFEMFKENL